MLCPHAAILALVLLCMDKILCSQKYGLAHFCMHRTIQTVLFCCPRVSFFLSLLFWLLQCRRVMLLFGSIGAVLHCIAFHYTHTVSEGCNAFEVKVGHFRMQLMRVCIFSFALKEQAVSCSMQVV